MPPRARTRANSGVRIPRCAVTHGGPTASKDTSPSRPLLPAPPTCELKLDSREDWSPETSVLAPCIFSDAAFARGARESTTPVSFSLSCACFAASAALVCAVAAALRSHSISPRLLLRLLSCTPLLLFSQTKTEASKTNGSAIPMAAGRAHDIFAHASDSASTLAAGESAGLQSICSFSARLSVHHRSKKPNLLLLSLLACLCRWPQCWA